MFARFVCYLFGFCVHEFLAKPEKNWDIFCWLHMVYRVCVLDGWMRSGKEKGVDGLRWLVCFHFSIDLENGIYPIDTIKWKSVYLLGLKAHTENTNTNR